MSRFTAVKASILLMSILAAQVGARAQTIQEDAFLNRTRMMIVKTIGAQDTAVEVSGTPNYLIVLRVNSNMNGASHEGRNNEASAIASVVSKELGGQSVHGSVSAIRVDYIVRYGQSGGIKKIDTVEFRKNSKGIFEIHMS
jgi:hypothetical protein